jgi:hypothetical protein
MLKNTLACLRKNAVRSFVKKEKNAVKAVLIDKSFLPEKLVIFDV